MLDSRRHLRSAAHLSGGHGHSTANAAEVVRSASIETTQPDHGNAIPDFIVLVLSRLI
jgi:hypothetical protein